jgi:DNA modification methylase
MNQLFYGDNLDVLQRHIADESIDLIYLDPPFNSNANYNVLFSDKGGAQAAGQLQAFKDTWVWAEAATIYQELSLRPDRLGDAMRAFHQLLPEGGLLAYLVMMGPRLAELHRVLKPTGSIYLHCDPTASHYLKVLMDTVFDPTGFRNELVWQRTSAHNDPSRYGRVHDIILFYAKDARPTWNQQYEKVDASYFGAHDFEQDEQKRLYRKRDLTAPSHGGQSGQYEWKGKQPPQGRMWSYTKENMERLEGEGRIVYTRTGMPRLKIYADALRGVPYQDVWASPELWLNAAAAERLGYPTQKPEALLERVLLASSNEGDTVLDPFCGCGTAIAVAQKLGRRWVGIDITQAAIRTIKERISTFVSPDTYTVIGEPTTVPDAARLAEEDPYQFQWWALGLVGARPVEQKKGADKGIDGRLYFRVSDNEPPRQVIFSVKAGQNVHVAMVHELRGVVEREKAEIGVLITMRDPTAPMRSDAASAGLYLSPWGHHPRLQILTVAELLAGKKVDMPQVQGGNVTFEKAPKARGKRGKQGELAL